jgi:hypothetical protein
MATKKKSGTRKSKEKEEAQTPLVPAVPPPDNPLLRFTEFDADREFHSKEMAEKRLEAIRQTQEMPTSDEEPPTPTPEPATSTNQSDSTDED